MIRALRETDLDQVLDIWLEANSKAHDFIPRQYWASQREAVRNLLPQAEVLVREDGDGALLGFCGVTGGDYIAGIFVRDGARSKGVGRQLLEAVKAGRNRLTLHVYRKNTRAIAFYRREGFTIQGQGLDRQTGEAELTMTWERKENADAENHLL